MKSSRKIKNFLGNVRKAWNMLTTQGKCLFVTSTVVGVLMTLKIAGVIHIGWIWFYGLPLIAFSSLSVAFVVYLLIFFFVAIKNGFKDGW